MASADSRTNTQRTVLPGFYKNVDMKTKMGRTLDQIYASISGAYKACPSPHFGRSDHLSLFLTQAPHLQV